ncbi:MAG TPA: addiction module antidote protein, HigA family [Syntrophomonas wolfei]|uniref:Addiction module antidote protein, HigA family n=1 Tax=Syntrophomonas wolfei TaxID=863 RepID=A0A354Z016_9FIRM|nr:addiction module antidote protein, HigA family [Syntrophomonas wolfei]
MSRIKNIHPGEVLNEEFLKPLGITPYALAKEIKVDQTRISEIIRGKRRISPDTAIRLGKYFKTSPQLWLGLQNDFDLEEEILKKRKEFMDIKPQRSAQNRAKKYSMH